MQLVRSLNLAGAVLAGAAILGMMLIGAANVIGMFAFNRPLPGAFEMTEALLVASVFLAMAMAQAQRQHVRVEVFLIRMPAFLRRAVDALTHLLTAGLFALLAWVSWSAARQSIAIGEFSSGLIQFPVWPARTALAVGVSLMLLQALADLAATLGLVRPAKDEPWTR